MAGVIIAVLRALRDAGPLGPGDVAAKLGIPRYKVLASFHVLNEFGLVEEVYSRGSYKIYALSLTGRKLLELAEAGVHPAAAVEKGVEVLSGGLGGSPAGMAAMESPAGEANA